MDWKGSYLGTDRGHFGQLKEGCQGGYVMGSSLGRGVALVAVDGRVAGCQNEEGWNRWHSKAQCPILPCNRPFGGLG
jgi:hypothetical protein